VSLPAFRDENIRGMLPLQQGDQKRGGPGPQEGGLGQVGQLSPFKGTVT
jgi:hypothetical protein